MNSCVNLRNKPLLYISLKAITEKRQGLGLKIMTFKELEFRDISDTHGEGAKQAMVGFENGYEVSVVQHKFSYGWDKGLYEIGVFNSQGKGLDSMCDPLDWGDTVKGWLTPWGVEQELELIKKL